MKTGSSPRRWVPRKTESKAKTVKGQTTKIELPKRKVRKVNAASSKEAPVVHEQAVSKNQVELFVFGIALGSKFRRPVLILKDSSGAYTLPVWLNPVDASHALDTHAHQAANSHSVTQRLLENFGLRLSRCVFSDLKGHHQFVNLEFSPAGKNQDQALGLHVRADEAMSLCLAQGARFYAAPEFIERCRHMDSELLMLEQGLMDQPELGMKSHKFMM